MSYTNIQYVIRKGFFDKLIPSGTTTLKTALKQTVASTDYFKFYYGEAPQNVTGTTAIALPYVVMSLLPITQESDTATQWYQTLVQFNVAALDLVTAEDIAGYLCAALEDSESTLSISGYGVISIIRGPQIDMGKIEQVWNIVVQYSLTIQG